MAETEEEKPQTLAEEKVEQEEQGEIPIEAAEHENPTIAAPDEVILAKADEALAVMESIEASEQEESEGQEAVEQTPEIKIETAPADFRFPTTNQTRHCFTRYIEYHRCIAAKGDGASQCQKFSKYYRSLCPGEWLHMSESSNGIRNCSGNILYQTYASDRIFQQKILKRSFWSCIDGHGGFAEL